jgi:peptidoglycan hydrolase-like protein with peptidoglycan-binding domain/rare lipoprotein A (peptidoglycan hydrolase)
MFNNEEHSTARPRLGGAARYHCSMSRRLAHLFLLAVLLTVSPGMTFAGGKAADAQCPKEDGTHRYNGSYNYPKEYETWNHQKIQSLYRKPCEDSFVSAFCTTPNFCDAKQTGSQCYQNGTWGPCEALSASLLDKYQNGQLPAGSGAPSAPSQTTPTQPQQPQTPSSQGLPPSGTSILEEAFTPVEIGKAPVDLTGGSNATVQNTGGTPDNVPQDTGGNAPQTPAGEPSRLTPGEPPWTNPPSQQPEQNAPAAGSTGFNNPDSGSSGGCDPASALCKVENAVGNEWKSVSEKIFGTDSLQQSPSIVGTASCYGNGPCGDGNKFEGVKTSNGDTFYSSSLTAASNQLPYGQYWVQCVSNCGVNNVNAGAQVLVDINNKGSPDYFGTLGGSTGRLVDLSTGAQAALGGNGGLMQVSVTPAFAFQSTATQFASDLNLNSGTSFASAGNIVESSALQNGTIVQASAPQAVTTDFGIAGPPLATAASAPDYPPVGGPLNTNPYAGAVYEQGYVAQPSSIAATMPNIPSVYEPQFIGGVSSNVPTFTSDGYPTALPGGFASADNLGGNVSQFAVNFGPSAPSGVVDTASLQPAVEVGNNIPLPEQAPVTLPTQAEMQQQLAAEAPQQNPATVGGAGGEILASAGDQRVQPIPETPAPEAPPLAASTLDSCGGVCGKGDEGQNVKDIQQALNVNGAQIAVDGKYGAQTIQAVKDYQSANGLPVDGNVGPKTLASLNENLARISAPQPVSPSAPQNLDIASAQPAPATPPQIPEVGGANDPFAAWRSGAPPVMAADTNPNDPFSRTPLPQNANNENGQLQNNQGETNNVAPKGEQTAPAPEPTQSAEADAAAAEAKRQAAISGLLRNNTVASRGLDALASGGSNQQAMNNGSAAAETMKAQASALGDTQLVGQINKYLALESQARQAYNNYGTLAAWSYQAPLLAIGRGIVQTVSTKYGR